MQQLCFHILSHSRWKRENCVRWKTLEGVEYGSSELNLKVLKWWLWRTRNLESVEVEFEGSACVRVVCLMTASF